MSRRFYRDQVRGAVIQGSSMLGVVAQSFLAPRLIGAAEFGLAVLLLSATWVVQGLAEPVLISLTIRWRSEARTPDADLPRLAGLWRIMLAWSGVGALASVAMALRTLGAEHWARGVGLGLLVALLLLLTMNTVAVLAIAYRIEEYRPLFGFYVVAGVVLPLGMLLLRHAGTAGFLAALCAAQVVGCASLLRSPAIRRTWRAVAGHLLRGTHQPTGTPAGEYLSLLAPRLAIVLFSTLIVLLASLRMSLTDVASFKLTISMVAAGTYLLPLSPWVLQAALTAGADAGGNHSRRQGAIVLGTVFAAGALLSLVLYRFADPVRTYLLRHATPPAKGFDLMVFALPFYVMINPLSSYLIAHGRERVLKWGLLAASLCIAAAFAANRLVGGFVLGTAAFVLVVAATGLREPARGPAGVALDGHAPT